MLIDEVTIEISAGNGGNGSVAFNKNKMELGPTGASGGNGGDVYCYGVADLGALNHFRNIKALNAEDGEEGGNQYRDGKDGKTVEFPVPVGTVIYNPQTNKTIEINIIGQKVLLAKGGKGGRGNFHFRSSTDTSPRKFEKGTPGEKFTLTLELKLIADVGLIGLPNVGKSSLMNELTRAQQKVANYPFTTLEPGLGTYYELILADIPGLIEGASQGKGLGMKFLRHIERTRTLFHLISVESEDPLRDYQLIRNELKEYNTSLLEKDEYIFLTKTDQVSDSVVSEHMEALTKTGLSVTPISIHDPESIGKVEKILRSLIEAKRS